MKRKPRVRLRSRGAQRCPLCRVEILPAAATQTCSGCGVEYHHDCLHEMGGCGTLGCARVGVDPDAPTPELQTRRARFARVRHAARERRRDRPALRARHRREVEQARAAERLGPEPQNVEPYVTWSTFSFLVELGLELVFGCLTFAVLLFAGLLRLLVEVV